MQINSEERAMALVLVMGMPVVVPVLGLMLLAMELGQEEVGLVVRVRLKPAGLSAPRSPAPQIARGLGAPGLAAA